MHAFYVELGPRRYPICVDSGLLSNPELLAKHIAGKQVLIVTNEKIAPLYLEKIQSALKNYQVDNIVLPDGEQYKTLESANKIFDVLLAKRYTRLATLIALGGGVIGDLTGFAAACYMRGVAFIQIPTTLLAQVDAAIGGKTAVNHALGKNMIGAFHQPRAVLSDVDVLTTLPEREFRAGLAEVIKYGLIRDADFFAWLEINFQKLLNREPAALLHAILRSSQIKADVVASDEHEAGERAILNLGHTFGHAIENALGYGTWLHGEAVAIGMLIAVDLSAQMKWVPEQAIERLRRLLLAVGLPVRLPEQLTPQNLFELMAGDKKNIHSKLRLVVLKAIGNAIVTDEAPLEKIQQTLGAYLK